MRLLKAIGCAAVLTALFAPGAHADVWNKKTILTFSGPVQIPGATLPAGSYVFKLADIPGNRHVVQVFDKDERKIYTTMLAIPNQRLDPSDKPVVLFSERASGSPQAIKVWYYPGETIGNEFVYPKSQAIRIAKETHQSVLAMNDDTNATSTESEIPSGMKTAELGRFDENGTWQSDDKKVAVSGNPAAETTTAAASTNASQPAPAPRSMTAANERNATAAGTSGMQPARKSLPRTGSDLALFELISGFSLAAGFTLRGLRARLERP
jgi:hypothetical protein